jgi:hypothetical protein
MSTTYPFPHLLLQHLQLLPKLQQAPLLSLQPVLLPLLLRLRALVTVPMHAIFPF